MKLKLNQNFFLLSLFFILSISLIFNLDSVNAITVIHNYNNDSLPGWSGSVLWGEKFPGLTPGQTINSLGLKISATGSAHVRVKIFDDNGTAGSVTSTNHFKNTTVSYGTGTVYANEFKNLVSGQTISAVSINVTSGSGTLRAKIYDDNGILPHFTSKQFPDGSSVPGSHPHTTLASGAIYLQKLTGLPPNKTITDLQWTPFATGTSEIRIKAYKDDNGPGPLLKTDNYNTGSTTNPLGTVYAMKFTGLSPGATITNLSLNATGCTACFAENFRFKIYQDDGAGGGPGTLLGESGDTSFIGSGCFPCLQTVSVSATVPASGNVWGAFEDGGTNQDIKWSYQTGLASGTGVHVSHTYGSGPSPFGAFTSDTQAFWGRLGYQGTISGYPNTIIYDGTALTSTGDNYFGVNITIPSSGNIWLGYEANTIHTIPDVYYENNVTTGKGVTVSHSYGTGPGPISGTVSNSTSEPFLNVMWIDSQKTGGPKNLLGESSATSLSSGVVALPLTATIPSSGNVWAAIETSTTDGMKSQNNLPNFISVLNSHSYGSGPNPFSFPGILGNNTASASAPPLAYSSSNPWIKLNFSSPVTSGEPKNLIAESGSIVLNTTGVNIFPLPVGTTIPHSGNVWGAFESDSVSMGQSYSWALPSGSATIISHTYGSGPSIFGTPQDQTFAPYMQLSYNNASITTSPAFGDVGNTIHISGSNMGLSNNIKIYFDNILVTTSPATVTTNSTGGFSGVTFIVPATSNGLKTINATNSAGISATSLYSVNPSSFLISPTSGNIGTVDSFTGTGFSELDTVTIKFDGSTVDTLTSDSIGDISGFFTIPSSINGAHTITATDTHGNNKTAIFTTNPSISISPTSGSSGKTITISGNGFNASSTINIYFNNVIQTTSPATVTTNSTGSFSGVTFTVPTVPANTYIVKAKDAGSNQATQNFSVNQSVPDAPTLAALALSPTSIRFTSVAGASPGDNPVIWYSLICQTNGGSWTTIVSNSSLPSSRIYERSGLQPGDTVGCEWRDGSKSGWSLWSNEASASTTLPLVQPPMTNNHLTTFIKWIADHGGIYFGFTIGPFIPMLIGLMATPKTVGIFAVITLAAMGIVHASGLYVYPNWYWGLMLLFGVVLVLSRANEK